MPAERISQPGPATPEVANPLKAQQERWNILAPKIEKFLEDGDPFNRFLLIERIAYYSLADGIRLAKRFGVDARAIAESEEVTLHHARLFEKLQDYVVSHRDEFNDIESYHSAYNFALYRRLHAEKIGTSERFDLFRESSPRRELLPRTHSQYGNAVDELLQEIKAYYAEFLKGRSVQAAELSDRRSQGEKVGESALLKMKRVHGKSYYAGPVRDALWKIVQHNVGEDQGREFWMEHFFQLNGMTKEEAREALFVDVFDGNQVEQWMKTLKGDIDKLKDAVYRPLAVVLDTEKEEATRLLTRELEDEVASKGAEVMFDEEENRYIVQRKSEGSAHEVFTFDISRFTVKEEESGVEGRFIDGQYIWKYEEDDGDVTVVLPGRDSLSELKDPIIQVVGDDIYTLNQGAEKTLYRNGDKIKFRGEALYDIREFDGKPFCVARNIDGTWSVGPIRMAVDGVGEVVSLLYSPQELFIPRDQNVNAFSLFFACVEGSTYRIARNEDGEAYRALEVPDARGQDRVVTPIGSTYAVQSYIKRTIEVPGVFKRDLRRFENVDSIIDVDGHCVFSLYDGPNGTFRVVFDDGEEETKSFRSISHLTAHGSSFLFYAVDDDSFASIESPNERKSIFTEDCAGIVSIDGIAYWAVKVGGRWLIQNSRGEALFENISGEVITSLEADEGGVSFRVEDPKTGNARRFCCPLPKKGRSDQAEGKIRLLAGAQGKLDLMNALHSTDSKAVEEYYNLYIKHAEPTAKQRAGQSKGLVKGVQALLKRGAQELLDTMAAKADRKAELEMFAKFLFPELEYGRYQRGYGSGGRSPGPPDRDAYLQRVGSTEFNDGDPRNEEGVEVLQVREPVAEMIVSGVYAKFDVQSNRFERLVLPIDADLEDPVQEHTFTIPEALRLRSVNLPFLVNAEIIPERVKGITPHGQEVRLPVETNILGECSVVLDGNYEQIVYSLRKSEFPAVPQELTKDEYDAFSRTLKRRFGDESFGKVMDLPAELELFVRSLRDESPLEKVSRIEEEVRRVGYYDFDNREVQESKQATSVEQRVAIMQSRMEELKQRHSQMSGLEDKLYAGVCGDFNMVVLAMLRKAGIASGMLEGFRPDTTSVTTLDAHAAAFVVWPSGKANYRIIIVDGTPSGVTPEEQALLGAIQRPSLAQQIAQKHENAQHLLEEAQERFAEMERILDGADVETIRELSNGVLEGVVNTILRYGVKESHVQVLRTLLNASQYSQMKIQTLDFTDLRQMRLFREFVAREVQRERGSASSRVAPAGAELFSLVESFGRRNGPKAYEQLERVFDEIRPYLDSMEARALIATIKYLEAKRIAHI